MIALTLRFEESSLPRIEGKDAARFVLDMLKEHPEFAMRAADSLEVKGPFGKVEEQR